MVEVIVYHGRKQELCRGVNNGAGAIDVEELKSVMTKVDDGAGAGEIEAVIAAVDHDDRLLTVRSSS